MGDGNSKAVPGKRNPDCAMEVPQISALGGCPFLPLSLSKIPCFGVVGWVYGSGMRQSMGGQGIEMDTNAGSVHTAERWERSPCQSQSSDY